nr:MAG TPA: hypothetical protein [Caudoviricetes sp.]
MNTFLSCSPRKLLRKAKRFAHVTVLWLRFLLSL